MPTRVQVTFDCAEAEMHRLRELGAHLLYEGGIGDHRCWTMADIEGNEFCVE